MQTEQTEHWQVWIALQQVRRIGPKHVEVLQSAFVGDLERAWNAPTGELSDLLGERLARNLDDTRRSFDLDATVAAVKKLGHSVIPYSDPRYPALLRETSAPPLVLYVLGDLVPEDETAVSVIGSRESTTYGRDVARQFSADFAAAGVTVVSGLARQIVNQGALISEYPTRTRPVPGNFRARNRIMAGISIAVVIVEARVKSGTLITANYAAHYNRDVFAVPGGVFSDASEGCLQLLREGAGVARSAADVLSDLNLDSVPAIHEPEIEEAIGDVERGILEKLGTDPVHIDDLAAELDLPIADVATALMMLELIGRVRNAGSQHFGRVR